jgi:riboflavin synthase
MFTGIVEEVGEVVAVAAAGSNRDFVIKARMAEELRVDQSVSHNGVCLTVTHVEDDRYAVTAVAETLDRSNISTWELGSAVNLERSLRVGDRLDGHMVQGHVDTTVTCLSVGERDGSWTFAFSLPEQAQLLVHKGSICLNGVSLTIAELAADRFSVAIIPYTFEHTNFNTLKAGDTVNVEYDVLGKYVQRMMARSN